MKSKIEKQWLAQVKVATRETRKAMKLARRMIKMERAGLIVALLVGLFTCTATAQTTNQVPDYMPPVDWVKQTISDIEKSTNWVVAGGYGHSVSGIGRNLAFIQFGANFNDYFGVIAGYDVLWGSGRRQVNSLRGGLTLSLPTHMFAFTGVKMLANIVTTPIVFDEIATSKSSTLANILGSGMDFSLVAFWNLELHGGVDYENRTGDNVWAGQYWMGHLAITRNF